MTEAQIGSQKSATVDALRLALTPLVDLLLVLGVTAMEAEDAMRDVFVRVASDQISRDSERVSLSRIALKCGLYRSEVSRRLALAIGGRDGASREPDQHRLNRLLAAWHEDPDFVGSQGLPRRLPMRGSRSFEELVGRYAANLYPAVVLEELQRIGAVRRTPGNRLTVLLREYVADDLDFGRIQELGVRAQDILRTLVDQVRNPRAGRIAINAMGFNIAPEFLPLVRRNLLARALSFAKLIDEELSVPSRKARSGGVRVGLYLVGVEDAPTAQLSPDGGPEDGYRRKRTGTVRRKRKL